MRPRYGNKLFHIKHIRRGALHFLAEIVALRPHFLFKDIAQKYRKRHADQKHKKNIYILGYYYCKRYCHICNNGKRGGENLPRKVFNCLNIPHYLRLYFARFDFLMEGDRQLMQLSYHSTAKPRLNAALCTAQILHMECVVGNILQKNYNRYRAVNYKPFHSVIRLFGCYIYNASGYKRNYPCWRSLNEKHKRRH